MTSSRYLAVLASTALLLFAAVWLWVAAMPLAYLDPEYPAWRAKLELLRRCELGDVLLLGDSRAAVDVMPALLPLRVTNLAVGGGETIEAYAALWRALSCPNPPQRVVISLDAAHFTLPDLLWERSVRFGFLNADDLAVLREVARETGDNSFASPQVADGLPRFVRARLYTWRFPSLYFSSLLRGGGILRLWRNRMTFDAVLAARGQYFFGLDPGSSTVAVEGHMPSFTPRPVLDHYFDRLLGMLQARGIPVDFVAMPMNHSTGAAVRPAVRDGFAAYLAQYAARYPGFRVVGPAMPDWPDRYFGDAFSHLNPGGAALLSARFGRCLQGRIAGDPDAGCSLAEPP